MNIPTIADVDSAAERLKGLARHTPLLENPLLNERIGGRLLVKAECLQRTGSFKFRGAYNRVSRLNADELKRGVVAFSSGNHAQGVAHAAQLCRTPAVIVMPADAPAIKIANTRAYGAEVVLYDRLREDREAIGRTYADERGMTMVPPFDDFHVIAGQGTVGLEIGADAKAGGFAPDYVVGNTSGGGMVAGMALALHRELPRTALYCAEPSGFDDHARSLEAGQRLSHDGKAKSFCDALLAPMPGEITFSINARLLKGGLVASDAEVETAIATAFHYFKIVVEPGGAVALAALIAGRLPLKGKTAVAVATGGNVDAALFADILRRTKPFGE